MFQSITLIVAFIGLTWIFPFVAHAAQPFNLDQAMKRGYDPTIRVTTVATKKSLNGCLTEELVVEGKDPVDLVPRKMNIKLYHSIDGIRYSDAIIIVPPTGGVNAIDLGYSNFFCQNGYAVALLDGFWKQNELDYDFQMHNYAAIRAIVAIKHTVVLLGQREVSTIGILGTSIGALTSAITLGFENKIKAATLIVGSARHADILVTSDEKSQVIPLRQLRMRKWGIKTIQGYGQAVRNAVRCEPGDYFLRHGARPVFAITATSDTTVLTKYQLELVEKLKASHISIPGGHMNAIISAYADYRYATLNFFRRELR